MRSKHRESPSSLRTPTVARWFRAAARCKTDEAIKHMAAKGGVMGITMVRCFVRAAGPVTIENVLDHIDHLTKLVGVEHAGIGSDVDLDGRDTSSSSHQEIRPGWNRLCQENLRSDGRLGAPGLFQPRHRTHSRRQFRARTCRDVDCLGVGSLLFRCFYPPRGSSLEKASRDRPVLFSATDYRKRSTAASRKPTTPARA